MIRFSDQGSDGRADADAVRVAANGEDTGIGFTVWRFTAFSNIAVETVDSDFIEYRQVMFSHARK